MAAQVRLWQAVALTVPRSERDRNFTSRQTFPYGIFGPRGVPKTLEGGRGLMGVRRSSPRGNARILIYSHDTFGLGHLRRCRAIAHALVEHNKELSVLILTGSPIIGSFDFRARVDFVRVPGVIKLRNGEYTPLNLHLDIEQTLSMR